MLKYETQDNVLIFKINVFLIVKNFLFVMILFPPFWCFLTYLLGKSSLGSYLEFLPAMAIVFLLYYFVIEKLTSVQITIDSQQTILITSRFIFLNRKIELKSNEFFYSYKYEIAARGSKVPKFTIYDADKNRIFRTTAFFGGWSQDKLMKIIFYWQNMGVKELN